MSILYVMVRWQIANKSVISNLDLARKCDNRLVLQDLRTASRPGRAETQTRVNNCFKPTYPNWYTLVYRYHLTFPTSSKKTTFGHLYLVNLIVLQLYDVAGNIRAPIDFNQIRVTLRIVGTSEETCGPISIHIILYPLFLYALCLTTNEMRYICFGFVGGYCLERLTYWTLCNICLGRQTWPICRPPAVLSSNLAICSCTIVYLSAFIKNKRNKQNCSNCFTRIKIFITAGYSTKKWLHIVPVSWPCRISPTSSLLSSEMRGLLQLNNTRDMNRKCPPFQHYKFDFNGAHYSDPK